MLKITPKCFTGSRPDACIATVEYSATVCSIEAPAAHRSKATSQKLMNSLPRKRRLCGCIEGRWVSPACLCNSHPKQKQEPEDSDSHGFLLIPVGQESSVSIRWVWEFSSALPCSDLTGFSQVGSNLQNMHIKQLKARNLADRQATWHAYINTFTLKSKPR